MLELFNHRLPGQNRIWKLTFWPKNDGVKSVLDFFISLYGGNHISNYKFNNRNHLLPPWRDFNKALDFKKEKKSKPIFTDSILTNIPILFVKCCFFVLFFSLEINFIIAFRGQDQNDIIVRDHYNSTGCSWEIASNNASERGSINICKGYVSTLSKEGTIERSHRPDVYGISVCWCWQSINQILAVLLLLVLSVSSWFGVFLTALPKRAYHNIWSVTPLYTILEYIYRAVNVGISLGTC